MNKTIGITIHLEIKSLFLFIRYGFTMEMAFDSGHVDRANSGGFLA